MADEQYIAAHVVAYPADKRRVLVFNRSSGRPEVLSDQSFDILRRADRFDTVPGHVKRLVAAGWEDDGSGFVQSTFRELVARGLMVSKSSFLSSVLGKNGGQDAPPPVTSVIVPTRDRIPQVQRCLGSWITENERHDRRPAYIVLDDSRDRNQRTKLREVLRLFASRGTKVFAAGMEEKTRFADELIRAAKGDGLPQDPITFALFGDEAFAQTYGANRNSLLLAAPAELSVMTDDDIVCKAAVPGGSASELVLSSMRDPTVCRFYTDRSQLAESVRTTEIDILSCHEKLLGRPIAGCMSTLGSDSALDVERVGPELTSLFQRGSKVVKVTASGSWGDSGMDSPRMMLELGEESRDLLMRSEELYAQAKESREMFRCASSYTISKGVAFATMNVGLDNRLLLPPFLPVGRNEDGIFAMTLHLCVEDALVGHLPVAVFHSPLEPRRYEKGPIPNPAPRLAEVVSSIASTFTPSPGRTGVQERLSELAKLFLDVGSLKVEDFKRHVESTWVAESSRYASFLEYLLDLYHGQPEYWAEDVQSSIDRLMDFTVRGQTGGPAGATAEPFLRSGCRDLPSCNSEVRRAPAMVAGDF